MTPQRDGRSRCTGCGCPEADCPISDDDAEWMTDPNGNHEGLCCEDCWHPNDNWQPANPHPQETAMSAQILTEVENLLHEAAVKLGNIGHGFSDKVHALLAELRGQETALQQEAVADATQVAHDASAAMGPVLAEAEKDAAKVGEKAVAAVEQDITAATQPPAAS